VLPPERTAARPEQKAPRPVENLRCPEENTVTSEDTVIRFFAAIEAGDIDAVRSIYAPDALIWHNDDRSSSPSRTT